MRLLLIYYPRFLLCLGRSRNVVKLPHALANKTSSDFKPKYKVSFPSAEGNALQDAEFDMESSIDVALDILKAAADKNDCADAWLFIQSAITITCNVTASELGGNGGEGQKQSALLAAKQNLPACISLTDLGSPSVSEQRLFKKFYLAISYAYSVPTLKDAVSAFSSGLVAHCFIAHVQSCGTKITSDNQVRD